jgi:hypothetical protein
MPWGSSAAWGSCSPPSAGYSPGPPRELDADLEAAGLTGDPRGFASALDKLERYQGGWFEVPSH